MKINIHNQTDHNISDLTKILKKLFRTIKEKTSMEIIFVNNDEIKRLNESFRHINKVTDVLSFPNENEDIKSLGDVFISLDVAKSQAESYGHSINREIGFLAVHGYLHLKGYDHHTKEDEKVMFSLQEKILKNAKLERIYK